MFLAGGAYPYPTSPPDLPSPALSYSFTFGSSREGKLIGQKSLNGTASRKRETVLPDKSNPVPGSEASEGAEGGGKV